MPKKKNTPTIDIPKLVQLPSGSWRCQVYKDGRSVSITDKDPNVVMAKAMSLKAGIAKARKPVEDMTLREACQKYIDYKRPRCSPKTIDDYERIANNHFQSIMDKRIGSITKRMLEDAVTQECSRRSQRTNELLAPKTIKVAYGFMASVLHKYYPDLDTDVDLPEVKRTAVSMDAGDDIIRAVIGTPVELPCLLAAWLSMTMSEIRGLTKSKSLVGRDIVISETVVKIKGRDVRKSGGKEADRSRVIRCPAYIRNLIDKVEGDIIVPSTPASITSRYRRILQKEGIPYISFHKLRHLSASTMAFLGVDQKTAQIRGGWRTSAVMEDIYTHSFAKAQEEAASKMEQHFMAIISHDDFTRK